MGKGSRNRQRERRLPSLSGMDASAPKGKKHKQDKQARAQKPRPIAGVVGNRLEVEAERDWWAESRCAHCRRDVSRKVLTRNMSLEDKAYCQKCWDKLPSHLRRMPANSHAKPWEHRAATPTDKQMRRMRKVKNAESNAILNSIPGTTLDEKLDSVARGLATKEPKPAWTPSPKRGPAPTPPPGPPPDQFRCDDCGQTGSLVSIDRHQWHSGHLMRSLLEV